MAESDTLARVTNGTGHGRGIWWMNPLTEFIAKTGFPILMALLLTGYVWFIGLKTNELMTRAVVVLEHFEAKDKAVGR